MIDWDSKLTVDGILTADGSLVTAVGLIFAAVELRRNSKVHRAQFLMDVTRGYFSDRDVRKFYYKIDYNEFRFQLDSFIGIDEERHLDTLVYTFDTMERLVRMRVLSDDDVQIFAFKASRVFNSPEVKKYFAWLDNEYRREGRPTPAHADARSLSKRLTGHR